MEIHSQHSKNQPLYSSKGINVWISYLKKNYPSININDILSYAGMEAYQLADQGHWFTQEQIDLFYERVVQLTGDENIARDAGRFAALTDASGVFFPYILTLLGPAKVYEMLGKAANDITRSCVWETEKIGSNKIKIKVQPKEGVVEKPYQCENRVGYFEAVGLAFKKEIPTVEHPHCMFDGDKACEYTISWRDAGSKKLSKLRNFVLIFSIFLVIAVLIMNSHIAVYYVLPLSIILLLLLTIYMQHIEKKELYDVVNTVKDTTQKYKESIDVNYNNALLINEIGVALNKQLNIDDILNKVISIVQERLDYDRGMILFSDDEKKKLKYRSGFGHTKEQLQILKNAEFNLDKPDSRATFVSSFHEQKPYIINDINEIKDKITSHSFEFAQKMGTQSFICVPIIYENESMGLLVVDNKKSKRPLLQSDVNLLMGIAPQIGISVKNAGLIQSKLEQFNSILFVLAASIDARDFLTAGHSEKVMEFSIGICNELGLPKEYTEMIRVAALLHDYGKIGVPDAILKKSGKLSPEEYHEIQTHAAKTRTILERISFEGIYTQIPEIAGCHHEKLDGSGYPKGLRGDEIPLGARIIAVADFFEAITAKRHYREPMQVDEAIELLTKEGASRLDPNIIEAFVNYYKKNHIN
jgi:HD-GYP domain-containing protein (c-di-GMP phosphodiesterase class II)